MKRIFDFFRLSFRAQLIYGIGLFLTLLLSVFIYIETMKNNEISRNRALISASDHSMALASMAKVWVMSNDYIGLEEALENFSVYDDLVFASIINMDGKVIAHTDKSMIGKYVADNRRISFLGKVHQENEYHLELFRNGYNIDVVRVIHNGDNHIGLVHLRFDQHFREKQITERIYRGIGFGLLYLATTIFLLYLIVNTFTQQLGSLLGTMKKVHDGDKTVKADEEGYNELSRLSREFNRMLDAISTGESKLNEIKERLEYAVKGSNDGLWDWNIEAHEVYFSPRWKEMLGYEESELPNVFSTWEDRVHPDDIEQARIEIALCHANPDILYSNIHRMRHKEGYWVWILARAQTIFDAQGKANRMVGFHTDITKQKELEAELVAQEEMMISQSRHVAMGEMIGMIAHQWRQPITVIAMGANNMLADIALESVDIENFKQQSQQILKQTQYLSKTIDDFRTFFRPNKEKDKVKIIDIFQEARQIIGKSLESHNIDLVIVDNSNEELLTYSRELLQVVLNLLKNAKEALEAKNMKSAWIHVTIESQGDTIITTVCDNGGGIEVGLFERIFEPYFSTKDAKTGTGLGLHMSKTIIEKHLHGSIRASNRNGGACFTMIVPKFFKEESSNG
jgi:PAS domain S-box-containing protein